MPLLYGEGTKAFVRLQEEIIKVSVDHTIFCWNWTSTVSPVWTNLIAPSPEAFQGSRDFIPETAFGEGPSSGTSVPIPVQINNDPIVATRPKKIMSLTQSETYPPELFDETRSVFRLTHPTIDVVELILQVGKDGSVIFSLQGPGLDGEVRRKKLLRLLASQVASMEGDSEIREEISKEIGGRFVIDGDGRGNGDGNGVYEEDERSIVTARLDLGLGKEKIMEISKRIEESLHI
ncbi:hypothetical protein EAF00_000015 [Botryotinia globosa]|nr:hypothetical protein EAF00_000015 [Botryotinia globosa]